MLVILILSLSVFCTATLGSRYPGLSFAEPVITEVPKPKASLLQHFLQRAPPPPDDGSFDPRSGLPVVTTPEHTSKNHQVSFVALRGDIETKNNDFPDPPSEIFDSPDLKQKQEDNDADAGRLDASGTEFSDDSRGIAWALRHAEMDNDRKRINNIMNRRMYRDPKKAAQGPS